MSESEPRTRTLDAWLRRGFGDEDSDLYRRVNSFLVALIMLSAVSIIVASVPWIYEPNRFWFDLSEFFIVAVFTIEYGINIYVAPNRRKYILGPWGIIDLLAILPSVLLLFDIRSLKVARLLRILRFLRVMRVLKLTKIAARKYRLRKGKLNTLGMDLQIYFIALFCAVTIYSTLVFYAEEDVDGTVFTSIPASMWWCIATITTTGYGDMSPATIAGKLVAACTMVTGLALFGLLMNVVGKAMMSSLFGADELALSADATLYARGRPAIKDRSDEANERSMSCACNARLNPAWRFCPRCGTPQEPRVSDP